MSVWNSVYVIQGTTETLGHDVGSLFINKLLFRFSDDLCTEHATTTKTKFQNNLPNYLIVHWNRKILPTLNIINLGIGKLPIDIISKNIDLLIDIPKFEKSTW